MYVEMFTVYSRAEYTATLAAEILQVTCIESVFVRSHLPHQGPVDSYY
jgi:hypothetical protein